MPHVPGTNYCGVLNRGGIPTSYFDDVCASHDSEYGELGWRAYFQFNEADKRMLQRIRGLTGWGPAIARTLWTVKEKYTTHIEKKPMPFKSRFQKKRTRSTSRGVIPVRNSVFKKRRAFKGTQMPYKMMEYLMRNVMKKRSYKKMPYKRRSYRRRRRTRRKYNKNISRSQLLRLLVPPKTQLYEKASTVDVKAGAYTYWAMTCMNCRTRLKEVLDDQGEGGAVLGGTLGSGLISQLDSASFMFKIRNLNVHPMYVQVYWLVCRKPAACTDELPQKQVIELLIAGWKERMLDADEISTGFGLVDNATYVQTNMQGILPTHSSPLCRSWKIIRGKKGLMQSGETVNLRWKNKRSRKLNYTDMSQAEDTFYGLTVVPLLKVHMGLGNDTTDTSEFLGLDGRMHVQIFEKYTIRWNSPHRPLLAVKNDKDFAFTIGGEGPTEFDLQVDE